MSVAIVTGASSGIGAAIYQHLRRRAMVGGRFDEVVGVSREGPDVTVDLSNWTDIQVELSQVMDDVSLLVNCAGVLFLGDEDRAQQSYIFNVNFWAPFCLMEMFEPSLRRNKGLIINIASVSGMMADPDTPIYGASKSALLSLTKSLAVKYAPDIRVNAISPGLFDTNLVPEPTPKELIDRVPLGFEAHTGMILPVVDMLIDSSYMTGSNVVVDGGLSCKVK